MARLAYLQAAQLDQGCAAFAGYTRGARCVRGYRGWAPTACRQAV